MMRRRASRGTKLNAGEGPGGHDNLSAFFFLSPTGEKQESPQPWIIHTFIIKHLWRTSRVLEREGLHPPQIRSFGGTQTCEQCDIKYNMGAFEGMVLLRCSVPPENPPQGLSGGGGIDHDTLAPSQTHTPGPLPSS